MNIYEFIVEQACDDWEDGTLGVARCVELWCEEHGISQETADRAVAWEYRRSAIEAGIPRAVIDGEIRLNQIFSEEYIKWKCGKA
jgi:hypothetical protein